MFPTVVSSEIERALLDYLQTTFHLQNKALETALFRYLQDGETGMFRGPYLDVRLPFRGDEPGRKPKAAILYLRGSLQLTGNGIRAIA